VFNGLNLSDYSYSANNPVSYFDPSGSDFWSWTKRNWINVASVGLSAVEIAGGVALTATGVASPVGVVLIVHGSVNAAAEIGKMVATSVVASKSGDEAADQLNAILPDSAIGFAAFGVSGGNKTAGQIGDVVDIAASVGIGAGASKAGDVVLSVAQKARVSYGLLAEPEQKAVAQMAKRSTAAVVTNAVVEAVGTASNAVSAAKKIEDVTQ
jgi:hypothetical protein